jgi:hypothetical protein
MFGGQSSGRGESERCGGGGCGDDGGAADEDPQAGNVEAIPIAAITRNIVEPPTALPIALRNSRRAIWCFLKDIVKPVSPGYGF